MRISDWSSDVCSSDLNTGAFIMSTENKSAAEIAAEVKSAFDLKLDAVKAIAEEVKGKLEKGEEISASAKELADQAITGMNESKARLDEIAQKMARKGSGEGDERKARGEMANEGKQADTAGIGRESGRARVGENVEITGVAEGM